MKYLFVSKTRQRFWEDVASDIPLKKYTLHTLRCEIEYLEKRPPKYCRIENLEKRDNLIIRVKQEIAFRILLEER